MNDILNSFFNGECYNAYEYFGAHPYRDGYIFRLYAPNAKEVEIIGDFNSWSGENHKMKKIDKRGIFELYIKEITSDYQLYKFNILTKKNIWIKKADPYAFFSELRPNTSSKTFDVTQYTINDSKWLSKRNKCLNKPLNIYELHLGSFIQKKDGTFMSYEEMASYIIKYVKKHHFTHIEVMPLLEGPLDMSWGYLCSSYFAITSRYGNPIQLKILIEKLHQNNIGVIMDFVPLHFIKDNFALSKFDGSYLYESDNKDKRESQWGSYLFDYSKSHVMSFMLSSICFFLNVFHVDGIRFDAISNMIYVNGNKDLGLNEPNINWIKKSNDIISRLYPNVMLIAEDSSDFGKVTKPTFEDGLGYDYKWDLGWMNDTLKYVHEDPYWRGEHLNYINFSMYYFFSEKFMLPFSHDEVVHMKGSIINKIFGSYEQKFQTLRTLYTYMFTHPGKKLNFMGNELAMFDEWNENKPLNFDILKYPIHDAFNKYFIALSKIYKNEPCLYKDEYNPSLFHWISCDNKNNVFIFERFYKNDAIVVILNFSTIQYDYYCFDVTYKGKYIEILNSDDYKYNGYGCINNYDICLNENNQIGIKIPSLGAIILKFVR